jgi:hypothetical protein
MDARSLTIVLLMCLLVVAALLTLHWWYPSVSAPLPIVRP